MAGIEWQSVTAEDFLEVLYVAANAQTDEEKARVAWRASDYMWWKVGKFPVGFCRAFNNICPDSPRIKDLWTKEERTKHMGVDIEKLGA
jgi:hypothetical protein